MDDLTIEDVKRLRLERGAVLPAHGLLRPELVALALGELRTTGDNCMLALAEALDDGASPPRFYT